MGTIMSKCNRTVCNNKGTHPHKQNKELYCKPCASAIDENVDLYGDPPMFNLKNTALYLDMDGVFANFIKAATDAFEHFHHIKGIYPDMKQTLKQKELRKQFIEDILRTPNFWLNMEWEPGGEELFKFILDHFDKSMLTVLTAPIDQDHRCKHEKWQWVQEKFKVIPVYRFIVDHDKYRYVNFIEAENQILIDDREDNIKLWEQHGGIGILHDSSNFKATIEALSKFV